MAGLEAVLKITAKDEAGGALNALKAQIGAIDKQIATFDKLAAAVGKISPGADRMIKSIAESTRALEQQKSAVTSLAEGLDASEGAASAAAGGQERLRAAIMDTTRVMAVQGVEAVRVAEKIAVSQRRVAAEARRAREGGAFGGMVGMIAGTAILHEGAKAIEAGASLEQMKFRLKAVSAGDKTEAPFAEGLAAEVAAKYPAITQAKALDTYIELRGNAGGQNGTIDQETARRNLMTVAQAQTAALAIGAEITPEDAQNLLKAVEGSGRAGDPTAVGKMFDSYLRAKQVFGSAIDSSKIRDYVQNAKGANFGIGDEQFFFQNLVRMTEGNASRLGNETAQTLQTLVGGHATKQTAKWLVDMGLASGFTPLGGGAATIRGLAGSDVLQVNQLDWAVQKLLPALQAHGVLSEANVAKREALLKKDNPNIDERTLRERAEAGLISAAIARSGMRTTVTDNLAHAIANELLIGRDVAQMKGASSSASLAASVGQNPAAALAELQGAIAQFGATVTGPLVQAAGPIMTKLAAAIEAASGALDKFNKAHPTAAPVVEGLGGAAVAGAAGWGLWKGFTGFLGAIARGLGLGGASGAAAAGGRGVLGRMLGGALVGGEEGSLGGPLGVVGGALVGAAATTLLDQQVKAWMAGGGGGAAARPYGPQLPAGWAPHLAGPQVWTPSGVALGGGADNAKLAAASAMPVTVSGAATVEHTVHVDVHVDLDPGLRAKIDAAAGAATEFTVPLIGGGRGQMDSDASPHRRGFGIGHM